MPNTQGSGITANTYGATIGAATPSLRLVATRCQLNGSFAGANKQVYARTKHIATDYINSMVVVFYNGYLTAANPVETPNGGTTTYQCQIEDVSGNIIGTATWGGATSGVAASGALIQTDLITLTQTLIPGQAFFVGHWENSPNGICFNQNGQCLGTGGPNPSVSGECATFGVTTTNRMGTGGPFNWSAGNINFFPAAILAQSATRSVYILGDSREGNCVSYAAPPDGFGTIGSLGVTLSRYIAVGSSSYAGALALNETTLFTLRRTLAAYCTDVILSLGINDLGTATTAAQLLTYLQTLAGFFAPAPVYATTISPKTDATNTTTDATANPKRVTYNDNIRLVPPPFAGVIDVAALTESALDSGLWVAGYTTDGLHLNQTGLNAIYLNGSRLSSILAKR